MSARSAPGSTLRLPREATGYTLDTSVFRRGIRSHSATIRKAIDWSLGGFTPAFTAPGYVSGGLLAASGWVTAVAGVT